MPYVKPELRTALEFINPMPSNAGELNYAISHLLHRYVMETKKGVSYANVNEVMGVMLCAGLEFYRTVVAPYENVKAAENGYVSELDKTFFESLGAARPAVAYDPDLYIERLEKTIAGLLAMQKPAKQPATRAPRKARGAPETQAVPGQAAQAEPAKQPATGAPLKPGETRVLTGPIPGDIPAGKEVTKAPVKAPPVGHKPPPPGPNATPGERALYAMSEGDDDEF